MKNILVILNLILIIESQKIVFSFIAFRHGARTNDEYFSEKMFPGYSRL